MSKLTCLHRPKSVDGDKVSIDKYFDGDKLEICLSSKSGDGDKVSVDGYFDGDKLEICLS